MREPAAGQGSIVSIMCLKSVRRARGLVDAASKGQNLLNCSNNTNEQ